MSYRINFQELTWCGVQWSFSTTTALIKLAVTICKYHHHHLFAQINWTWRTHHQHENKSRTRKAEKTGAYILPIKNKKNKHTWYKNNYDYAYRKNTEKSTRLSDHLNLDNDEKSMVWGKKFQTFIILSIKKFLRAELTHLGLYNL